MLAATAYLKLNSTDLFLSYFLLEPMLLLLNVLPPILLIWFSITLGFIFDGTFGNSFIYPGGLHGYNVSNWLISQVGIPGLGLLLFITALLFFVYLSNETIQIIRKALHPNFKRKKKGEQASSAAEESPVKETPRKEENKKEFSNPGPAIVDFELEQPEKIKEEVEDQVPFPFENNQVAGPEMEQEPAYVTERRGSRRYR